MEDQIKMVAKIYKCRDTAKRFYGDDYQSKISDYKHFIQACMIKHNYKDEIIASIRLISDCQGMEGSGIAAMNILAACAELIEPSTVV
jgi:hypothetical protein